MRGRREMYVFFFLCEWRGYFLILTWKHLWSLYIGCCHHYKLWLPWWGHSFKSLSAVYSPLNCDLSYMDQTLNQGSDIVKGLLLCVCLCVCNVLTHTPSALSGYQPSCCTPSYFLISSITLPHVLFNRNLLKLKMKQTLRPLPVKSVHSSSFMHVCA